MYFRRVMILKSILTYLPLVESILQLVLLGLILLIGSTIAWTSRQQRL